MPRLLSLPLLILALATAALAPAQTASPVLEPDPPLAKQGYLGPTACGPTALYNLLASAPPRYHHVLQWLPEAHPQDKLAALLKDFGSQPSTVYPNGNLYQLDRGTARADLLVMTNAVMAAHDLPPMAGHYLDRRKGEPFLTHLARVHRLFQQSLAQGVPVIVSTRSFVARQNVSDDEHLWHGAGSHFLTVTTVQETLAEREAGFTLTYINPVNAKTEHGYIHAGLDRNFAAAKGNTIKFQWVKDRPFLLVTAPHLWIGQQDAEWHQRSIIVLDYAIYLPGAD